MKKQKIGKLLFACLFIGAASFVHAQPGGPGGPGGDPDNTRIPFDGGISLVIAAGVAYAAKKGYDKRKKNQPERPGK